VRNVFGADPAGFRAVPKLDGTKIKKELLMKVIKYGLLIGISIFIAALVFVGFEVILRATGNRPIELISRKKQGEPVVFEEDSLLGWKCRPGIYDKWPKSLENSNRARVTTIWPDGSRATGPVAIKKDRQIISIGCSFTFGWAISDEETFSWKLQKEFPEIEFLNYGTNGYSSYQSLLFLERYFQHPSGVKPLVVFYGFCAFHEDRNVASFEWLRGMRSSNRVNPVLPYCAINNMGALERMPPISYEPWVASQHSVVFDRLQSLWWLMVSKERVSKKEKVTKALLLEMNALCEKNGTTFVMLLLEREKINEYKKFALENQIQFVDCAPEGLPSSGLYLKEDGHPSGLLNSYWTRFIADYIRRKGVAGNHSP
jgi:hypothetical protein